MWAVKLTTRRPRGFNAGGEPGPGCGLLLLFPEEVTILLLVPEVVTVSLLAPEVAVVSLLVPE